MTEIGAKGRKVTITARGDRVYVAVSKKGRPVTIGLALEVAKKRVPGVEWEFTQQRSHDTLVTSKITLLATIG